MLRAAFAVVALALLAPAARADDVKKVLEKLQGEWAVEAIEENGKRVPTDEAKKYAVVIKEDKFAVTGPEGKYTLSIRVDPAKAPPQIDLVAPEPKGRASLYAIYELRDGTLTIAGNEDVKKRPAEFSSTKGCNLLVLKRK